MAVSSFSVVKAALGASFRNYGARYFFTDFKGGGAPIQQEIDGTAAVVTDAGVNTALIDGVPGARTFAYFVEQAFGGTAPQLVYNRAGGGLGLVIDAVNNDGLIFAPPWCTSAGQGTLLTAGFGLFTARTDAFYFRCKYTIDDVSAYDELNVGVRKVQAFNTSGIIATENTDFFGINLDNGTLKTVSNLNDAGVSTTSTTQTVADAGTATIEIRVSSGGVVKSYVDGANPTVEVTNFTFDSGDLLMPYVSIVADSTDDGLVHLLEWEHGLLSDRGLDSILDISN